jgi:putative oxidoreductase
MKHTSYSHHVGLLIVRIILAGIFLYHGLGKIGAGPDVMGFVGGAAHSLGLTFLSTTVWFYVATAFEVIGAALILFGAWTRIGAIMIFLVMVAAMNAKGWAWSKIEMDAILAMLAVALYIAGPGKYSICKECCGAEGACGNGVCKK